MKPNGLFLFLILLLTGCGTPMVKVNYTDDIAFKTRTYSSDAVENEKKAGIKKLEEKYSPNLVDYRSQYLILFLEAKEEQAMVPEKPDMPFLSSADTFALIGTTKLALMATGSSLASNLFSPGFVAGGVALALMQPKSEEEWFVFLAQSNWRNIREPGIIFYRLDLDGAKDFDKTSQSILVEALKAINRAAVCDQDSARASIFPNYMKSISEYKCVINEKKRMVGFFSQISPKPSLLYQKYPGVLFNLLKVPSESDEETLAIRDKLKPLLSDEWIAMYAGKDSDGQRRLFMEQGNIKAKFDLPPYPFAKNDKKK